jgi:hypothetical protein
VDSWLSSGLENRRPFTRVAGSNPVSSAILPLRISVSTHGFGPCGGSSILSGVTKMVIWSSGLGAGLQTQLGGFDSYYHLNGFGGNPRIDDESMSTKMPRGQVTGDGSYLFLEWLDTISRYGSTQFVCLRVGGI